MERLTLNDEGKKTSDPKRPISCMDLADSATRYPIRPSLRSFQLLPFALSGPEADGKIIKTSK